MCMHLSMELDTHILRFEVDFYQWWNRFYTGFYKIFSWFIPVLNGFHSSYHEQIRVSRLMEHFYLIWMFKIGLNSGHWFVHMQTSLFCLCNYLNSVINLEEQVCQLWYRCYITHIRFHQSSSLFDSKIDIWFDC